ncbi:MAG: TerB family tellurite resistance protein, partial [Microcystaceae cyanobacterium]
MSQQSKTKQLLKILIGAAWLDGVIQTEERNYLKTTAERYQLQDDPDIQVLLSELKPVQANECYQWLEDYLGANHTEADYQEL